MNSNRLIFLGTGTSTGVPQIGCGCRVCSSSDHRDKRLRTSALLHINGYNLLIDCGPDFRQQILRLGSPDIEALLVTHVHYDHLGGLDDLRPYALASKPFPIYCKADVAERIPDMLPYAFGEHPYPGSPRFAIHEVGPGEEFSINGSLPPVKPLLIKHTETLGILGFRIGNLGYVTDCKIMPEKACRLLENVDTLVINALRLEKHHSHMNLHEALDVIKLVNPRRAYLTHVSHRLGLHAAVEDSLPEGVRLAYDGLEIEI